MRLVFGKTKEIESRVDEFLDIIVKGVLAAQQGIRLYLMGDEAGFASSSAMVYQLENRADDIRKRTETTLYSHSLIPESRGDVLSLLENLDNVIDAAKSVLQRFEVERPEFPPEYHEALVMLAESCSKSVDNVVAAARSYFREIQHVRDFVNKVDYYEKEADRVGLNLKRLVFSSDLELCRKIHLRFFIDKIESVSDIAEAVAELLAIAAIKRSL